MSGVMRADICDILPGVEDIEDIIGAEDVTPRDRYHNKPVPVPKVRKPKKTKPQVGPEATRYPLPSSRTLRSSTCQISVE